MQLLKGIVKLHFTNRLFGSYPLFISIYYSTCIFIGEAEERCCEQYHQGKASCKTKQVEKYDIETFELVVNLEQNNSSEISNDKGQWNNGVIDKKALRKILELAINYCIDFDLLTPPYDNIKELTVETMQENTNNMNMKTGKRLGFMFHADAVEMQE